MIPGDKAADLFKKFCTTNITDTAQIKELVPTLKFLFQFNLHMGYVPEARYYRSELDRAEQIIEVRKQYE